MSVTNRLKIISTALLILLVAGFGAAFFIYDVNGDLLELNNRLTDAHLRYEIALRPISGLQEDLIEMLEGYSAERSAIDSLRRADEQVRESSRINDRIAALNRRTAALDNLVRTANRYPQLRNRPEFRTWREQFDDMEAGAAHSREQYNAAAENYNQKISGFTGNILAMLFGIPSRPLIHSPAFTDSAR
jgi:LemA protein